MSASDTSTGLIVLAAGASRRLGRPKQLLMYKGRPLLQQVLDLGKEANCRPCVVVLGAYAEVIRAAIDPEGFEVVINSNWKEGMASSIRCGLSHVMEKYPDLRHVAFLLTDQPCLTSAVLDELLGTHRKEGPSITACAYGGGVGVPAVFSRDLFPELMELKGDQGARKLLINHAEIVERVPFEKGMLDVDTEEDWEGILD